MGILGPENPSSATWGFEGLVPGLARKQTGVRGWQGPCVPGGQTGPHKSHSKQLVAARVFRRRLWLERLHWKIGHSTGINEQFTVRGQGALSKKRVTKELSSPGIQLNNPFLSAY